METKDDKTREVGGGYWKQGQPLNDRTVIKLVLHLLHLFFWMNFICEYVYIDLFVIVVVVVVGILHYRCLAPPILGCMIDVEPYLAKYCVLSIKVTSMWRQCSVIKVGEFLVLNLLGGLHFIHNSFSMLLFVILSLQVTLNNHR